MKYIVTNCPAFMNFDEQSLTENKCYAHDEYNGDCCNITDCNMKKLIDKCKHAKFYDLHFTPSEILQMFEIEEIE